ncbi:MAG: amidohydrolase family protein [Planctomycetaceae bacterium]|nr:amidohydrolase family protein [Planctomycetaceae bacterium]
MADSTSSHCLRARWLFPVDGPPIEDGLITIESGRIVSLNSGPDASAIDLGNVAIIPGLVNTHTHLEFSDLTRPLIPAQPFPEWIRSLVGHRQQRPADRREAIDRGLRECVSTGCTLIGEIATDDTTVERLSAGTPQGAVFRELLGIGDEAYTERLEIARQFLGQASSSLYVIRGLSPHAPYSLSEEFFRQLIDLAVERESPVAMHLAETHEELELLRQGTGLLAEMLKDFGVWRDRFWMPGGSVGAYLEELSRAGQALVVHGNYLNIEEIEFLATQPQMTVVYCPRTHHFFGHRNHPWRRMLESGVNVALGTDSRASNPDLNLWAELRFLAERHPEVPQSTLLELATVNGARALGVSDETGTLTAGKQADLAVVRLTDQASASTLNESSVRLVSAGHDVIATMRGGRWVHR